jgi:hypothetical protein
VTTTDNQSLALRDALDDDELAIVEKGTGGFGLGGVSPPQRAALRVLARAWRLQLGREITFMFDQPYVTFPGRLTIARRHPQFAGWSARAISDDREKAAWGFASTDIVVEGTIHTRTWGEITARGRVTEAERTPTRGKDAWLPVQKNPGEQAEKRALMRASRLAFGEDQPTDEDFERAYQQQLGEPLAQRGRVEVRERPAVTAADYDRIIGRWYDDEPAQVDTVTGEVLEQLPSPQSAVPSPQSAVPTVADIPAIQQAIAAQAEPLDITAQAGPRPSAADLPAIGRNPRESADILEELPDLGEPIEPPMPTPERRDSDSLGAFLARLRRRIEAHPDRDVTANKALQMAAGTAVLAGCDNDRAAAKRVLKVLTARTDNLTQLTMGEAEEILSLSGVDPAANEEWQTWCGLMDERATALQAAR